MIVKKLCAPALLYLVFSLTQIIIDIFKNMYNTAFFKFIVMVLFTLGLNILCQRGLGVISWFIVFIPFIMMTVITTLLLFVFGLSPSEGSLDYSVDYPKAPASPAPTPTPAPTPAPTPTPTPAPMPPPMPVPVPVPVDPIPTPAVPVPIKPVPSPITPSPLNPVPDVPTAPFQSEQFGNLL
jgi:hypothetical protein